MKTEEYIILINEKGVDTINLQTLESIEFDDCLKEVLNCYYLEKKLHNLNKKTEYGLVTEYYRVSKRYSYGIRVNMTNIFGETLYDDRLLGSVVVTKQQKNKDGSTTLLPFSSEIDAKFFVDNYLDAYVLTRR